MLARRCTVLVVAALLAAPVRVAADETTPQSPLATWLKGEGFRIQSPDGNWKLRVGLQAGPWKFFGVLADPFLHEFSDGSAGFLAAENDRETSSVFAELLEKAAITKA